MRKMKDSGIAWIGEIPETWTVERLRFAGKLNSAGVDKKIRENEDDTPEDKKEYLYKSIHYMDVYAHSEEEIGDSDDYLVISATRKKAQQCALRKGDILFTSSSETPEDIGHSTELADNLPGVLFGYHLTRFRPSESFASGFLKYLLGSSYIRSWFEYRAYGMTRYGISYLDFADARIMIPPLEEQQKMTRFLDEQCRSIRRSVEQERRIIDQLTAYKQSLITETVTKGLHPEVARKDSGVEWIGEIPDSWKIERLKFLAEVKTGPFGTQLKATEYVSRGTPCINVKNIGYGAIKADDLDFVPPAVIDRLNEHVLKTGDIVFARKGSIDKHAIITKEENGWLQGSDCIRVRLRTNLNHKFFNFYLANSGLKYFLASLSNGATMASLNGAMIGDLLILLPPPDEQREIASFLDAKCAAIDADLAKRRALIERLSDYKRSLIYEVVTGKREV